MCSDRASGVCPTGKDAAWSRGKLLEPEAYSLLVGTLSQVFWGKRLGSVGRRLLLMRGPHSREKPFVSGVKLPVSSADPLFSLESLEAPMLPLQVPLTRLRAFYHKLKWLKPF